MVQEWIDGEPLQVAAHKVLSPERMQQVLRDLLPAIAHVHSKNVIHRDIKPDNIIIRKADQQPCLIDFGAVKELMSTVVSPAGMPQSSIVIGTEGYMPQEQAAGRPTIASDLYSLGMTAICVLTGKHPAAIPADSRTGQLLWQQSLPTTGPTISPTFASVLTKAIHPYPQHRYHSAAEMLTALTSPAAYTHPPHPNFTAAPPLHAVPASQLSIPAPDESAPASVTTIGSSVAGPLQSSASAPLAPTKPFPTKSAAIAATAFAIGAGILVTVRPKPAFESATAPTNPQTVTASTKDSSSIPSPTAEDIPAEPTTAEDFTDRATLLYDQGRLQQASQDVEAALEIEPNTIAALMLKGDILVNQSRIDLPGAIAAYTQALTLEPNNPDLLQKRCTTHQNNNNLALAEQDCTQLLTLTPNNALLYDQRGDIRNAQENYLGAIADYTQAIEINEREGNPAATQSIYYSRAPAYSASGAPAKGLADFEKMREQ